MKASHPRAFRPAPGLGLGLVMVGALAAPMVPRDAIAAPADLTEALIELGTATAEANDDPALGAQRLRRVLDELPAFADDLATNDSALRARTLGWLTLARAQLNLGDRDAASAAVDAALRSVLGGALDTDALGPTLSALAGERIRAMGERHALPIRCEAECVITIEERSAALDLTLPAGEYRVRVRATDDAGPSPISTTLTIPSAAPLVFGGTPEAMATASPEAAGPQVASPGASATPASLDEDSAPANRGRLLPRWAEISAMALGAGAVGTGAALLVLHGKCTDGGAPTGANACDNLYETRTAGIAALASGGVLVLGSTLFLGVDEVRAGRSTTALRIRATLRF